MSLRKEAIYDFDSSLVNIIFSYWVNGSREVAEENGNLQGTRGLAVRQTSGFLERTLDCPSRLIQVAIWLMILLILNLNLMICDIDFHVADAKSKANIFTYDSNSFIIDGKAKYIFSGSIHYPRSSPSMWPRLAQLSKEAGINMIQTYVFWNIHEESQGVYDFTSGRKNLTRFLDVMQEAGLLVNLRVGPYVCAEWDLGGIPGWVRNIDGIVCRTYNQPWLDLMHGFFQKTLEVVEPYLLRNGGPIVILQVENEYGNRYIQPEYKKYKKDKEYIDWCASNITGLEPDAIWIMCEEDDAPDSVIRTCNGFTCDNWIAKHKPASAPAMYTEAWPGWYTAWSKPRLHRPVEDVLFSVISWFAKGGAYINYYMWHGGTNWGRSAAEHFIQSYDYDTALNEFGFPYHRKYDALAEIHHILDSLQWVSQTGKSIDCGPWFQLIVFENSYVYLHAGRNSIDVSCGYPYPDITLHGRSAQIFLTNGVMVFDSSKISSAWNPESKTSFVELYEPKDIQMIHETPMISSRRAALVKSHAPMDQLLFDDTSDYLWYEFDIDSHKVGKINISVPFEGTHVFIQGRYVGSCYPENVQDYCVIETEESTSTTSITFLSSMLGVQDHGAQYAEKRRGLLGKVDFGGHVLAVKHQNGLDGEYLNYPSDPSMKWEPYDHKVGSKLVWYRLEFGPLQVNPKKKEALAVDLSGIGKGQAYINGHHIGRFWDIVTPKDEKACTNCNWFHGYNFPKVQNMCGTGCGEITQSLYHIANDWLSPRKNILVIFTETGGNPTKVRIGAVVSH